MENLSSLIRLKFEFHRSGHFLLFSLSLNVLINSQTFGEMELTWFTGYDTKMC